MAETFGVIAGALSVAALFNNCVNSFEYIQLGRHFGRDFERCQLKLDVVRTRLGRWGQTAAINDNPHFAAITPPDRDSRHVRAILEELEQLFQLVQKSSKRYEMDATEEDLGRCDVTSMERPGRFIHDRLTTLAMQRQKSTGLLKKVTWALYDSKNFDRLIEHITGFIDDLEQLFPQQTLHRRQLVGLETEEIQEEPHLRALRDAAAGVDQVLAQAAEEKLEAIATKNLIRDIRTEHSARVQVGDEWSCEALSLCRTSTTIRTTNEAGMVAARGASRVQVGQRYGGQGIFVDTRG